VSLPEKVREKCQALLWSRADELGWSHLSLKAKTGLYSQWTKDPRVGGELAMYMNARDVRVYIKDSLVKPYELDRQASLVNEVLTRLTIDLEVVVAQRYVKPHGMRLIDGKVICWSKSRDWKSTLMAAFERAQGVKDAIAYGVVFFESGVTEAPSTRNLIRDAARRLGIENLKWIE